jgi:hypothetical protein
VASAAVRTAQPNPLARTRPTTRVIYVLGTGRCGSTVLDLVLGSAPGVVSVGELWYLPTVLRVSTGELAGFPALLALEPVAPGSPKLLCSCGQAVVDCPVWTAVRREALAGDRLAELDVGNRHYEGFFSMPIAGAGWAFHTRSFDRHLDLMAGVAHAISSETGNATIVDSSKFPWRAWLYPLLRRRDVDVKFVHLVRNGETFLKSIEDHFDPNEPVSPPPPWPRWALTLFYGAQWVHTNLLSSMFGFFFPDRYILVKFEDLSADPVTTLRSLARFLDLDVSEVLRRVEQGLPLLSGHVVLGNRSKSTPVLRWSAPGAPNGASPVPHNRLFRAFAGWLQRYYGYS